MEFLFSGAINYIAVAAITVASVVLGYLWYGPLFGKCWRKAVELSDAAKTEIKKKSMIPAYILTTLGSALTAVIVAIFINYTDVVDAKGGAITGLYLWLVVMPVQLSPVLWERKSWICFFVNASYTLVTLVGASIVLTLWV